MAKGRILYINQEIIPYSPETEVSYYGRYLPSYIQEQGREIRTFMPRFSYVNERRNQLHEVIRLSGMNLIINDNDHQLIIKVASIPSARIQIYFIDNDDYFERKAVLVDEAGEEFEDNDERAIFFARGVLETVKKLNWTPTVVHCLGWMSAITPIYLKKVFNDDPLFRDVKIVVTLCDDRFEKQLSDDFKDKIANEIPLANGMFSFDDSIEIMGALEAYGERNSLTGITLYENGSYEIYSDRITLGSNRYIPNYGFGLLQEGRIESEIKYQPNSAWKNAASKRQQQQLVTDMFLKKC